MQLNDLTEIPTFQDSHGDFIVSSTIDYTYIGQQLRHQLQDTNITRLHSHCTDHSLLHISLSVGSSPTGPGLWETKSSTSDIPDRTFGQLQHELAAIHALKADTRRRENGEKSAYFLKHMHQQLYSKDPVEPNAVFTTIDFGSDHQKSSFHWIFVVQFGNTLLTIHNIVETALKDQDRSDWLHRSDNGLMLHLLQQSRYHKYPGIGLFLDQEKVYDRVHPQYFTQVLETFGFSYTFTQCIKKLFFGNSVKINVNGFFSPTVLRQRGLRQANPLSPILFNLALEPLLLSITQDESIIGYQYNNNGIVQHIKTLAYADEI
ncbi:hypothetical protein G6F37_010514 [Rhizopus arrhizus]|nr:hypothetical protein G6F38_008939 [Rhizopus arrhizus]KAG1153262.1 hypothetical protein G6F37_010514 [Rhizopus arrhizus]